MIRKLLRVHTVCYRHLQYLLHGVEEFALIFLLQLGDLCPRVNPGLEEDLVGIDIADTGDEPLIHQGGLDHRSAFQKGFAEGVKIEGRI